MLFWLLGSSFPFSAPAAAALEALNFDCFLNLSDNTSASPTHSNPDGPTPSHFLDLAHLPQIDCSTAYYSTYPAFQFTKIPLASINVSGPHLSVFIVCFLEYLVFGSQHSIMAEKGDLSSIFPGRGLWQVCWSFWQHCARGFLFGLCLCRHLWFEFGCWFSSAPVKKVLKFAAGQPSHWIQGIRRHVLSSILPAYYSSSSLAGSVGWVDRLPIFRQPAWFIGVYARCSGRKRSAPAP